jgi:hypothetical protein
MKTKVLGAAVAAALLGLSTVTFGQGVGGSAGGTGASGVDTPREANQPTGPGANADVTGPRGSTNRDTSTGASGAPVTSSGTTASGGGVGASAGGTGASPVDTPREANRSAPGANADVTGPQGTSTARCDALTGAERTRCLRDARPSSGASSGIGGVGGSAGGTGASPVDTPREANRSAPGGNPDATAPRGYQSR